MKNPRLNSIQDNPSTTALSLGQDNIRDIKALSIRRTVGVISDLTEKRKFVADTDYGIGPR